MHHCVIAYVFFLFHSGAFGASIDATKFRVESIGSNLTLHILSVTFNDAGQYVFNNTFEEKTHNVIVYGEHPFCDHIIHVCM